MSITTATQPAFHIGRIPIYGRAMLSPMAGYSDVPYRAICRAYGSALNVTEFVPVEALFGEPKRNRFWMRLDTKPGEYPMVFQIFGNDPQKFLQAAVNIMRLEPDIIDINMGCSTRRVSGRGAGVGMMQTPELISKTFALLTRELPVPVTGKIRLGWDDNRNYLEVGRILEDSGAAMVAIHGRTKEQKYTGCADWDAIAHLKQTLSVPVIGNGDITLPDHVEAMMAYTGCDAVMIGRGAIGNPWIFAGHTRQSLTYAQLVEGIRRHLEEMIDYYDDPFGLIQFRKHFKRYAAEIPAWEAAVAEMVTLPTAAGFFEALNRLLEQVDPHERINASDLPTKEFESCEAVGN